MPDATYLTSPLLQGAGFRHAFFTRHGGVSAGAYASLNFSYAVGDEAANVDENLRRAAAALGVAPDRLYFAAQVHGRDVLELDGSESSSAIMHTEADAIVSGCPDLACAVRTADCLPILIADRTTGRAVAAHAGWRGLVGRVIDAVASRLGGDPTDWVAAIGPHISTAAFEVSEDVARELEACSDATAPCVRVAGEKPKVDLAQVARAQLLTLGIAPEHVEHVGGCTRLDPMDYFSFRRDGRHSGRHLSAIVPRTA